MSSSSLRSDSERPQRPSAIVRTTMLKRRNLSAPRIAVSAAARNKVTKTVSEKQLLLLRNNSTVSSVREPNDFLNLI